MTAAVHHPSHPESGFYADLSGPTKAPRSRKPGHLAKLSAKQNKTVLGRAAERIREEARTRSGKYLRSLDGIHGSGCRTRQPRWDALAKLAEPMLARVDLATLVLGWIDMDGRYHLNRQCGLADDAGLSDCCVSRTLSALESAKLVRRQQRRLFKDGNRWITRTMIHLRRRFFHELGLWPAVEQARKPKVAKRKRLLAEVGAKLSRVRLAELQRKEIRARAHVAARAKLREREQAELDQANEDAARNLGARIIELAAKFPDLTPAELRARLGLPPP